MKYNKKSSYIFIVVLASSLLSFYFIKGSKNNEVDDNMNLTLTHSIELLKQKNNSSIGSNEERFIATSNIAINASNLDSGMVQKFENKKSARTLWLHLLDTNFEVDGIDDLFIKLRSIDGGRFLYEEIYEKITQENLPDHIVYQLLKTLMYSFDGGSLNDGTFNEPKNKKDSLIQSVMNQQQLKPAGKESLKKVMDLLYYLESGDLTNLLEETISNNKALLTEKEKLDYRLHYSGIQMDRFSEVISQLNNEKTIGYYDEVVYRYLSQLIGYEKNDNTLLKSEEARVSIASYLEKNPVYIEDFNEIAKVDTLKASLQLDKYAFFLKVSALANGEKDIDKYMESVAIETDNSLETVSIISYQASLIEETDDYSKLNSLIENKLIKQKLQASLNDSHLSGFEKDEIKNTLRVFFNVENILPSEGPKSLEDTIISMSSEEKLRFRPQLENFLQNPSLGEEDKLKIQEMLEVNFDSL